MKLTSFHRWRLALLFSFLCSSFAVQAAPLEFNFRVFLDEREMGTHRVTVDASQNETRVSIAADFEVKILFYKAFEYTHRVDEIWRDDCLVSIDATTDNNGEDMFVQGKKQSDAFHISSHNGDTHVEGCVRSFAYWDPQLLKTESLLNMQTGEYEQTQFKKIGREALVINDKEFDADKYSLTAGDKVVYLWYSPEKEWLALSSRTEDDYEVRYYSEKAFN